jgi:Ca2+-binding RTX toxin-like protein
VSIAASQGTATLNQDQSITFTPAENLNGTVSVSYDVSDGISTLTVTENIIVNAVNDIPVVSNALGEMSEDDVNVTGGVASDDVDGDTLSYHLLGDAPEGVSFNNGAFTVTPLASDQALGQGQTRVVTFQYVANDGQADSLPATAQITINGVNDAPTLTTASAILANGQENMAYTVTTAQLLEGFSDVDSGDVLSVMNLSSNHGTVTDNGNGTFTIAPTANYNGSVNINYQVSDGKGGLVAATQSFNLIKAVNVDTVGTTGGDMLHGSSGDDTFIVNHVRDVVFEAVNGGIDTVQSSLSHILRDNVENLILVGDADLSGTGNNANNSLTGNNGKNRLLAGDGNDTLSGGAGGDTLNGGAGADIMFGGTGNDTFTVENTSDTVTEFADEGFDTVNSFISYTLTANVERLILEGMENLNGFGNDLDNTLNGNNANNWLVGGLGNDTLHGKGGADTLEGGIGNDLYYVDNAGDIVTELANEGTDKVSSSMSYTLAANVEQLFLTGIADLTGTGNDLNNVIYGNGGDNHLDGGLGDDSLNGGLGDDSYQFGLLSGRDLINNTDASDGLDVVFFDAGITADQVWLRHVNNDLEVSIIGTANSVKVQDWYSQPNKRVDGLHLADGRSILASEIETLVSAMAAFTPPAMGQTSLTANQHDALDAVIAANWS